MSSINPEISAAPDHSLVALVDCDTFYASCERIARPDLVGKPIVVLSNNDGCIVARSREAKALELSLWKHMSRLWLFTHHGRLINYGRSQF